MTGTKKTKYCVDQLLKRPPAERAAAAEALLQSLDDRTDASSSPRLSQAWVDEIQRRIDENAPGIPASIVFSEGRARLRKLRRPLWSS